MIPTPTIKIWSATSTSAAWAESSEHNAEYNNFFIKSKYPELIDRYKIPLDEYPRRCINHNKKWEDEEKMYLDGNVTHTQTKEYCSHIMNSIVTGNPYVIGGNVLNTGLIDNLPSEACVEVKCLVDNTGIHPTHVGKLPTICAAMNMTNINVQLLTIEAAVTKKKAGCLSITDARLRVKILKKFFQKVLANPV